MKRILLILVPIIAIAVVGIALYCNKESEPMYYYDFDEVIHYHTDIDEHELLAIREKKVKTIQDSMMLTMTWNYYRVPLTRAVTYLDSIDFKKQILPSSKFPAIKEIFKEGNSIYESPMSCEPVYRNIYVFKKSGKVTGVAMLCYGCQKGIFIGTNADTQNFGSEGEFEKLKEIVK